jgi:hypothetical protein
VDLCVKTQEIGTFALRTREIGFSCRQTRYEGRPERDLDGFACVKPCKTARFSAELCGTPGFSTVFSTVVENLGEKPKAPGAFVGPDPVSQDSRL